MRIASLLPSATEIVCALGAGDRLVARSHECDFPPEVARLPVLTRPRIGPLASSRAIDAAARRALADAMSIYEVDIDALRAVRPDVVVTQDLCDVCAVSLDDARAAVARLARRDVRLVNLGPLRLDHIWTDIARTADGIGCRDVGVRVVGELVGRVAAVADRARRARRVPSVLTIEWIDPVMIGGLWMPELVALAGGAPLVTRAGEHGRTLTRGQLATLDPDVVLVAPCGFTLERTMEERGALVSALPAGWRAVRSGRVYVADGSAFFNRSGPRIVESVEILAGCIHPEAFADLADKHRASVVPLPPPAIFASSRAATGRLGDGAT